jgi:hypothetical protein
MRNSSTTTTGIENDLRPKRRYHRSQKRAQKPAATNTITAALPPWVRQRRKNAAPITPTALRALGAWLCTFDEAVLFFGCSTATLARYMRTFPELKEAWHQGRELGKASLRRQQLKVAFSGTPRATPMLIHLGRTILGQSDKKQKDSANARPVRYSKIRRIIA